MSTQFPRAPSTLHVLVVEDEAIICEALCMNLEDLGVGKVSTAANGRKALRHFNQGNSHPDLILLDVYMPEMDGIEFLNALLPSNYTGAVALMSGVNIEMLDLTVRMASDLGFRVVGAAEKPVPAEALKAFLQAA